MPSVAVNLTEYNNGTLDFQKRYSVAGVTQFASLLSVGWDDLLLAVETNGGINPVNEIALRFVHRYNSISQEWFVTMAVCHMDGSRNIDAIGSYWDITQNGISQSTFTNDYDPDYFGNVLFNGNPINMDYVHNVVFPWYQQISEVHCQNNLPMADPDLSVIIAPVSFDYSALIPNESLVPWPHTLVLYMQGKDHGPYLDDAKYTQQFTNRAGDVGTLCPPTCGSYSWPAPLPVTPVCRK